MPTTIEKQKFLKGFKTRAKGGWKKKAVQEPKARGQALPPGLIGAVAQVSSYRMGEYEDHSPYVTIVGIGKSDEVAGMRVNIGHTIKETESKTIDKCMDDLSADLQLLGGVMVDKQGNPRSEDEIPKILDEIIARKPHFTFNTKAWNMNGATGVKAYIQGECDPIGEDVESPEASNGEPEAPEPEPEAEPEAEGEPEAPEAETQEAPWEPEVGEGYKHKGKDCEITGVQKSKKTVTIKKGKATLKDVKWDDLESAG
jgi:hypothetical protein